MQLERVLKHRKATLGRGILFKRGGSEIIKAYTDVDYVGTMSDRRSTSSHCTYLCWNLVAWMNENKNVVARWSAKAEFRAMTEEICELLWMKQVQEDLKMKCEGHMKLFCDNKSTISIAHNLVQHDTIKHIEIDIHSN
jgi:hypothetical protein